MFGFVRRLLKAGAEARPKEWLDPALDAPPTPARPNSPDRAAVQTAPPAEAAPPVVAPPRAVRPAAIPQPAEPPRSAPEPEKARPPERQQPPEPVRDAENRSHWLCLDVETTGFSPMSGDRVVSVCAIEVGPAGAISRFEAVVNPGRSIPPAASAVHGIRDAHVRDKPRFAEIAVDLAAYVGDRRVLGYNLRFDLRFLVAEFKRARVPLPPGLVQPGIDVMAVVQALRGTRMKLWQACEAFGVDLSGLSAHSASGDAMATALLFIAAAGSTEAATFQGIVRSSQVSVAPDEVVSRTYDDDDLEAAFRLFEERRHEEALGREPNPGDLRALSLGPISGEVFPRRVEDTLPAVLATPKSVLGRRPAPTVAELAGRLLELLADLEKVPEAAGQRLARCRAAPPYEHALKELAVCLRKEFAALRRSDADAGAVLLRELHDAAQRHAFLHGPYPLGGNDSGAIKDARLVLYGHLATSLATPDDLDEVVLDYREVGYRHLPLLNATDVKRLVAAFGEPDRHLNVRERHAKVWERIRRAARARKRALNARRHLAEAEGA